VLVSAEEINFEQYDVIVAGSGLASFSLVSRLSKARMRTLVLETGRAEFDDLVQSDFSRMYGRGHYEGSHWPIHWVRALGGTSAVWAGWCGALSKRNFRAWPIEREELDDYYLLAANYLRRTEVFLSFSTEFLPGFTYRPISDEDPLRLDREPEVLLELSGVDFALGTTLNELHVNGDRTAVEAVSLYELGGKNRKVDLRLGQSIVLAAGGIGNAQILLSSQPGDAAAVGNEYDQVGRYLMEHPHFMGSVRMIAPTGLELPSLPSGFGSHVDIVEPDDNLFQAISSLDVSIEFNEGALNPDDPVEAYLNEQAETDAEAFDINVRAEMPADPANRLKLAEGTDPSGLRRLRAICYIGTETFRAVDSFLETLSEMLMVSKPARVGISSRNLVRGVSGGGHIMGTTRMGVSPRNSVVDADCRVHGYANLFIAGSSVFTSSGYINPTLTIMALAARLGDYLSRKS